MAASERRTDRGDDDRDPFARGVRVAIRNDSAAFSYSILVTATFGMANLVAPGVTVLRIFLFALGATGAFAVLETLASRGFRIRLRGEPSDVVVLGTVLAPLSVTAAIGGSYGALRVWPNTTGWFAAPLVATTVYVVGAGLQMMAARRYEEEHPPEESG